METVSLLVVAVLSFAVAGLSGYLVIPRLKRLHIGQTISEYVKEHRSKANTPTMGGVMFIVPSIVLTLSAIPVGSLMGLDIDSDGIKRIFASVVMIVAMTAVGFIDDYIKVVKKRNLGLTELQKTVFQVIIAAAYLATLRISGAADTSVLIPFTGFYLELGIFWYPIMLVAIYGFVNAVNFTDGIDGLCAGVTAVVCCFFIPVTAFLGAAEHAVLAAAVAGALAGFLIWNFHPAKVFMGDTGSMFLGGTFVALAFSIRMPLIMIPVGFIYFIEFFSDVIQIAVIRLSHGKKKVFKMAPIHHHYQLSGWSEVKIVAVFSAITAVMCGVTALWIFGGLLG